MRRHERIKRELKKVLRVIEGMKAIESTEDSVELVEITNHLSLEVNAIRDGMFGRPISFEIYAIKDGKDIDGVTIGEYSGDLEEDVMSLLNCYA